MMICLAAECTATYSLSKCAFYLFSRNCYGIRSSLANSDQGHSWLGPQQTRTCRIMSRTASRQPISTTTTLSTCRSRPSCSASPSHASTVPTFSCAPAYRLLSPLHLADDGGLLLPHSLLQFPRRRYPLWYQRTKEFFAVTITCGVFAAALGSTVRPELNCCARVVLGRHADQVSRTRIDCRRPQQRQDRARSARGGRCRRRVLLPTTSAVPRLGRQHRLRLLALAGLDRLRHQVRSFARELLRMAGRADARPFAALSSCSARQIGTA